MFLLSTPLLLLSCKHINTFNVVPGQVKFYESHNETSCVEDLAGQCSDIVTLITM